MNKSVNARQIATAILAIFLWLLTVGLGLEGIYVLKEIYYLISVRLGGSIQRAEVFVPVLMVFLGLFYLGFIVVSTEYHRKKFGHYESWRLFGWTIAAEVSLLIIYYLL